MEEERTAEGEQTEHRRAASAGGFSLSLTSLCPARPLVEFSKNLEKEQEADKKRNRKTNTLTPPQTVMYVLKTCQEERKSD